MPVQRCILPLPIPLNPLWTVQPVQSLSSCTTVHFTFTYTSTSVWTVQPIQSLRACTTVHFTFTYTSTPPMDRTACTKPQCLYKGALNFTYTPTPPMERIANTEPQCLYNGALYPYVYLYFLYGPCGLYRATVTLQVCTLLLPLLLLSLLLTYSLHGAESLLRI